MAKQDQIRRFVVRKYGRGQAFLVLDSRNDPYVAALTNELFVSKDMAKQRADELNRIYNQRVS